MNARTRILDLLPVTIVFAIVALAAVFVIWTHIATRPLVVPPPQGLPDGQGGAATQPSAKPVPDRTSTPG